MGIELNDPKINAAAVDLENRSECNGVLAT
jgi:hypothetical protein